MNYRYMTAMRAGVREMRMRGRCNFDGGSVDIGSGDIISVRISEGNDSGILPGSVLSAACTLVLDDSQGKWREGGSLRGNNSLKGAVFELELGVMADGEWLFEPLGVYVCREAVWDEGSTAMTMTCTDMIDHVCEGAFSDELSYPARLGDVWQHICNQAGVEWRGEMPCADILIDAQPRWGNINIRTAMGYAAQASGCYVRIDRSGRLMVLPVWQGGESYPINPGEYMSRSRSEGSFGPVKALRIKTVNAKDDNDSKSTEILAGAQGGSAQLNIQSNPLFITGASHVSELAQEVMDVIDGLTYLENRFMWRGDPAVEPGGLVEVTGLDGAAMEYRVSRQTLEFSGGFTAECVCGVPYDAGTGAVSAGNGREIEADRLIGFIPGAKIDAYSISAEKIAAGAVTAEKIAAGAVEASLIDSDTVIADILKAGKIETDMIGADSITSDKIAAGAINAEKIAARSITAELMQAGLITADSGLIAVGAIQTAQIADGSITAAKIVSLDADVITSGTLKTDRLLLVGEGGVVYEINAAASGLSQTELTKEQYKNQINGTVIVANSITAAQIAAGTITANEIAANAVTAAKIDAADIFSSQATIQAINAMDISGNRYLRLMVAGGVNLFESSGELSADMLGWYSCPERVVNTGVDAAAPSGRYLSVKMTTADGAVYEGGPYLSTRGGRADVISKLEDGETYTVSVWVWCSTAKTSGRFGVNFLKDANVSSPALEAGKWTKHTATGVYDATGSGQAITFYYGSQWKNGDEFRISSVKVERGSIATDWTASPLDPAGEVIAGSTLLMNRDSVRIETPEFEVNTEGAYFNIPGAEDGSSAVEIGKDGLTAENITVRSSIQAPNIREVISEECVYTVGDGCDFPTMQAAFDAVNDKDIDGDVILKLYGAADQGGVLRGIGGAGRLIVAPVNLLNSAVTAAITDESATLYSMGYNGFYLKAKTAGALRRSAFDIGHIGTLGIRGKKLTLRCTMYSGSVSDPAYPHIRVYCGKSHSTSSHIASLTRDSSAAANSWTVHRVTFTVPDTASDDDILWMRFHMSSDTPSVTTTAVAYFRNPIIEIGDAINTGNVRTAAVSVNEIRVEGCQARTYMHGLVFMDGTAGKGLAVRDGNVSVNRCTFKSENGFRLWGGCGAMYNCYGACTKAADARGGGAIEIFGTVPGGTKTGLLDTSNMGAELMSGDEPAAAPKTVELTAKYTGTYSGSAWWTGDAAMRQGWTSTNHTLRGAAIFDLSSLSGKTVSKAVLRIKRVEGYGKGGDVDVKIYRTNITNLSGAPAKYNDTYVDGKMAPGETRSFDVTEILRRDNLTKAFVLQADDSSVMDGKSYSKNFARFAGKGSEKNGPVLTVTYE